MAHVCPLGAGDVTSAVAAGVSEVAARTLRKTWKLRREVKMSAHDVSDAAQEKMITSSLTTICNRSTNQLQKCVRTCELTAAAAEFSKASTASSQPRKPLTGPLSLSPLSGTPPKAPSRVAGPVTSPPNCCCSAANQMRSSSEAGVGP